MKYSAFRKNLLKMILDEEVLNIDDLLHRKFKAKQLSGEYPIDSSIKNCSMYKQAFDNFDSVKTFFQEFIDLCSELAGEKFIYFDQRPNTNDFFPYCFYDANNNHYFAANSDFEKKYNQWQSKNIIVHDQKELSRFLKLKFLTEKDFHELKYHQSQRILVWIAIGVSILTLLTTIVLNLSKLSRPQPIKIIEPVEIKH
jgi:hypothetical protein